MVRALRFVLVAMIIAIMCTLTMCTLIHNFFDSWVNSLSPTELIRQETERILQIAQNPTTTQPFNGRALCRNVLHEALKRNNNRYSIEIIGVWGDYASPIPSNTGSIEALVHVVFPDGTRFEMQYYAYALLVCREIAEF